jgi:hypothetical protein
MDNRLKLALAAGVVVGGMGLAAQSASAMPMNGLASGLTLAIATGEAAQAEQVRWVCGPWGCRWRPNYWGGYYGPRPFYGPRPYYGYGRPWGYGGPRRWGYGGGWGHGPGWGRHW